MRKFHIKHKTHTMEVQERYLENFKNNFELLKQSLYHPPTCVHDTYTHTHIHLARLEKN